jgi:hypothetical protein
MSAPTAADRAALGLVSLPADVEALLVEEQAPPRLFAHLTLVHDVSRRLLAKATKAWPRLPVDVDTVAFGAATHDIGKARFPAELSGPGSLHEAEGERLLLARGVSAARARFARTHGADRASLDVEELLVVVADTVWKGKRDKGLDDAVVAAIARATRQPTWQVFMTLDAMLEHLAKEADARLEWQGRFSI